MKNSDIIFKQSTAPETIEIVANARRLTKEYYFTDYKDTQKRNSILKSLFGSIGENVVIDSLFHCNYGKNIYIGNDVIININCTFIDDAEIYIGSKVLIASNVHVYTAYHPVLPEERFNENFKEKGFEFFNTLAKPVYIDDGAWLGGGVIVLPGVKIGKNSVIGAGSVVNRSIPDNCVAVGNPCKPIKFFEDMRKR